MLPHAPHHGEKWQWQLKCFKAVGLLVLLLTALQVMDAENEALTA